LTRVVTSPEELQSSGKKASSRTWATYKRLIPYAMEYKFKIFVVLLFSIVVAASLTSIIFGVGSLVDLLYMEVEDPINAEESTIPNGDETELLSEEEPELPLAFDKFVSAVDSTTTSINKYVPLFSDSAGEQMSTFLWGLRDDPPKAMRWAALIIIILTLIGGFARYIQEYYAGVIGASITTRLNREMFENILKLPHEFFENHSTGEIVARFTNDSFMVNRGLLNVFVKLVREPIKIVTFLGVAFTKDVFLTSIVLFVLSPLILILIGIGQKVKKSVRRSLDKIAAVATIVTESVKGITVVKSFRMETYKQSQMGQELIKLRRQLIKLSQADAAVGPATEVLLILGVAALLLLTNTRMQSTELTNGDLLILFAMLASLVDPLRKMARTSNMIQISAASAERVFEFIDVTSSIQNEPDAKPLAPIQKSIDFNHVDFSYDGEAPILRNISFSVNKGEMVALVGFSGSGKSTIAKLIPRFYDPQNGSITIDGTDIREATVESLREQIGYVTQENVLFHESILENISFGRDTFEKGRVQQAAKAAHADEFIEPLPKQYDTELSESAGNLSGGQRQRIAIARAIIKDPAILILDEATSSLDSKSERAIQEAIEEFVVGRTTIVIAHRLSTIQQANRIIVLDHGKIIEEGSHRELLDKNGAYSRLYQLQFAEPNGSDSDEKSDEA
jgi:subfamily B ATP-binding cassette protein MsbA